MTAAELKAARRALPEPPDRIWRRGPKPAHPTAAEMAGMLARWYARRHRMPGYRVATKTYQSWEAGRTVPPWVADAMTALVAKA